MKQLINFLTIGFISTWSSQFVLAQDPREPEIIRLESLERESVLKVDSLTLFNKIWSPKSD